MKIYQFPDPHPDPYVFGSPGSARQRYGSEEPDPYQYVKDPQHCILGNSASRQIREATLSLKRFYTVSGAT
jgi:hypothetical protein